MKNIRIRKALSLLLSLTLLCAAPLAQATSSDSILGLFENTKLDVKPYAGKALFLNFFTEWCPYCMEEMPEIKKLFETYRQEDLQIILIHVWDGENEESSRRITKKYGLEDMTFFEDQDMSLAQFIGLPGYPTSLFIDKDGNLTQAIPSALSFEDMAEIVESMGVAKAEPTEKNSAPATSAP